MKKILLIVLLLIASVCAGETEERNTIKQQVKILFQNEKYEDITKLANHYLNTEERTSGGRWKLRFLHAGIYESMNRDIKELNYWNSLEKKLLTWIKLQPNEAVPYISYTQFMINKAWMHRGYSYAKNVSKKNWELFKYQVNEATKYLISHKDIASRNPHWYTVMLNLAKINGSNKIIFNLLMNEGVEKYPHYYSIYELGLYYMDPKWNNFSKKDIENLAQKILKYTDDKDGTYARFYWMAKDIIYDNDTLFYASDINWTLMSQSIDNLLTSYPTQYNINELAYLTCLSGDEKKTQQLMNKIIGKPIMFAWGNIDTFNSCKGEKENYSNIIKISADNLDEYIEKSEINKPQLFYFSTYDPNSKISRLNNLNKLAKKYSKNIDVVSVNLYPKSKIYQYPNIYYKYYMQTFPSLMLIYKKKIILRINYVKLEKKLDYYSRRIATTLEELVDPKIMQKFKESIVDKASYINSDNNARMFGYFYNTNNEKNTFKAQAFAVSLYKNRYAMGNQFSRISQDDANQLALEECERERAKKEIKDHCKLHSIGDQYVYESIVTTVNPKRVVYPEFKYILETDIKEYVLANSDEKPQFIHFKRAKEKVSKSVVKLAKGYNKEMNFLLVDMNTSINTFDRDLEKYFDIHALPYSVVVYKKKVVLINKRSHVNQYTMDTLNTQLKYLLNKLKDNEYFNKFSEGINEDKLIAYTANLNTLQNTQAYLNLQGYKSWFVALGKDKVSESWINDEDNITKAIIESYTNCNISRIHYNIYNKCKLYMFNNEYISNKDRNNEVNVTQIINELDNINVMKTVSENILNEYIEKYSNNKPLVVYFGNDSVSNRTLALLAKTYVNDINFVSLDMKKVKDDSLLKRFKKQFNIRYPSHTVLLYKNQIIFSNAGRIVDGSVSLNRLKEELSYITLATSSNKFKYIPVYKLSEYLEKESINKPIVVHFGNDTETLKNLKQIIEPYEKSMELVVLSFDRKNLDYVHKSMKKKFFIPNIPQTVVIFKNKIILNVGGILKSYTYKLLKEELQYLSKKKINEIDLENLPYRLNMQKDLRYITSLSGLKSKRTYTDVHKKYKAWSLSFGSTWKSIIKISYGKKSQEEADIAALNECERERQKFKKLHECTLYMSGNNYVYDKNITKAKMEKIKKDIIHTRSIFNNPPKKITIDNKGTPFGILETIDFEININDNIIEANMLGGILIGKDLKNYTKTYLPEMRLCVGKDITKRWSIETCSDPYPIKEYMTRNKRIPIKKHKFIISRDTIGKELDKKWFILKITSKIKRTGYVYAHHRKDTLDKFLDK